MVNNKCNRGVTEMYLKEMHLKTLRWNDYDIKLYSFNDFNTSVSTDYRLKKKKKIQLNLKSFYTCYFFFMYYNLFKPRSRTHKKLYCKSKYGFTHH